MAEDLKTHPGGPRVGRALLLAALVAMGCWELDTALSGGAGRPAEVLGAAGGRGGAATPHSLPAQAVVERRVAVPFKTLRWADPEIPRGETRVIREGRPGEALRRYRIVPRDDGTTEEVLLEEQLVREPVHRIVGVGTRPAAQTVQTPEGPLRYRRVLQMEATAYTPGEESTAPYTDGLTATGVRAGPGIAAVDPAVIPLGTRLYVPGYGFALAADVGAAIKGLRIDLGFATYQEAVEFGRRPVTVYLLDN